VPAGACPQLLLQLAWQLLPQQQQDLQLFLALLLLLYSLHLVVCLQQLQLALAQLQLLLLAWLQTWILLLLLLLTLALLLLLLFQAAAVTPVPWHSSHTDQHLILSHHLQFCCCSHRPFAAAAAMQPYQLQLDRCPAADADAPTPLVRVPAPNLMHPVTAHYP
jgi:hypothetical protein